MRVSKRERRTERVRARDTEGGVRGKVKGEAATKIPAKVQ